jgi:hypothetical protein
MSILAIHLGIIVLLAGVTWALLLAGQAYIGRRKRLALKAPALESDANAIRGMVRILAFSTETCRQCHTHQWPAIERVMALRSGSVVAEEIDAILHADLAARYQILTVPSTVVLNAEGVAQAVNYGFANTQRLLEQIDAIPAKEQIL